MNKAILLIAPVLDALLDRLESGFTVYRLYEQTDAEGFLRTHGTQIGAVVTRGDVGVTRQVLAQLPAAGLIAIFGVGTDAVDLAYAKQRGIAVTITSGVLTNDVADMALALLLATARQLCQGDRFVREGRWLTTPPALATQVSGKRIGIFGMGNIGRAIARRASGFDMSVRYTDRTQDPALPYQWYEDVQALARQSDFFVIAASGGKANTGIIDAAVFKALPRHAIVINIARGNIVDQPALINALESGEIAGAGLDVYEQEPNVPPELIALNNVVLQPHVASATHETRQKMGDVVFANVDAFFKGQPLPNAIE